MLGPREVEKLVKDRLFPGWENEREHLDKIDCWYRWQHEDMRLPRTATAELRRLQELSKTPWLSLVVTAMAQAMYVDGYRSTLDPVDRSDDVDEMSPPWKTWLANGMDRRQIAVHRATFAYGQSYVTVLPGVDPLTGAPQAVMRGVSPRKMYAAWDDPAEDDWPQYALRVVDQTKDGYHVRVYDDTAAHTLLVESSGGKVTYQGQPQVHDAGVCPVVRYANMLDLDGRAHGEVEPYIALAARINKTSYDRMVVQHFNSWKIRYITGMTQPDDEETRNRAKLRLRQDDLLISDDPDTKFGSLDETNMSGFIAAHQADVETLAAASQTPTHELTGQLANLSADALAAARASLTQKVTERQKGVGQSHAQALRLAAAIDGHDDYAQDVTGRVSWQDMEIRSMSQAADALGKMVQMLGVPPTATWGLIPGIEKSDVTEWTKLALAGDPITQMQQELARQSEAAQGESSTMQDPNPTFGAADTPVAGG
jgi:HPt (histidine-containing phosphotransfer) domain-containing protein